MSGQSTENELIGKIVRDVSSEVWPDAWVPHYAIGKTGFLDLHNGQWVPYDSAFPGPSYFDQPAFRVIGVPTLSSGSTTTDPITCTGCTREVTVGELCVHSGATCALCCGKYCGGAE